MSQDTIAPPRPAPELLQPEAVVSPALDIYEHFMGLQRLKGWLRDN